jgi:hypothetical protein
MQIVILSGSLITFALQMDSKIKSTYLIKTMFLKITIINYLKYPHFMHTRKNKSLNYALPFADKCIASFSSVIKST